MERKFQINWPAIVEEAKQRRKKQRLTQKRLATLAGISTPTLSRFENGEKDIQLSSIMNILDVLGMIDRRQLTFLNPKERYDSEHEVVRFNGNDGGKTIQCAISREALEDHFGNDNDDDRAPLKMFIANREAIGQEARRKYFADQLEPNGTILIRT